MAKARGRAYDPLGKRIKPLKNAAFKFTATPMIAKRADPPLYMTRGPVWERAAVTAVMEKPVKVAKKMTRKRLVKMARTGTLAEKRWALGLLDEMATRTTGKAADVTKIATAKTSKKAQKRLLEKQAIGADPAARVRALARLGLLKEPKEA